MKPFVWFFLLFVIGVGGASCARDAPPKEEISPFPFRILAPVPEGEQIIYSHHPTTPFRSAIRSMKPDGTGKVDLITFESSSFIRPELGPGHRRLAFKVWDPSSQIIVDVDGRPVYFHLNWNHIWLIDGAGITQLTGLADRNVNDAPHVWSSDGETLFYSHEGNIRIKDLDILSDPFEIWAMNADGSNQRKITDGQWASLSPDGKTLAVFRISRDGLQTFLMNPNGSNPRLLRDNAVFCEWAPDGVRLACIDQFSVGDIILINTRGELLAQLTHGETVHTMSWSPDGQWLAYFNDPESGPGHIFKIAVDGASSPVRLTDDGVKNFNLQWVS